VINNSGFAAGIGPISDFFKGSGKVVSLIAIIDYTDGRKKYRIYLEGYLFVC
jgi:hypothetical protein